MKKSDQELINRLVQAARDRMTGELNGQKAKRLRSSTAWVTETENFYVLRSYNTIVACIDKRTDTCYDFLRLVYGYTATSASHIAKFAADYGKDKFGTHALYRYYCI